MKSITIPDSVTTIDDYAFSASTQLTDVIISSSVTEIGIGIFNGCWDLSSDKVLNNSSVLFGWWVNEHKYKEFGNQTMAQIIEQTGVIDLSQFKNSADKEFNIIGGNAFEDCSNLTSFCVPDSIASIGKSAFRGCEKLEEVIFSQQSKLSDIGSFAFVDCTSLKSIIIPDSVTEIGDYTFEECTNLENVKIPNSITRIGNSTFFKCTNLKGVYIPESAKTIGNGAFYMCTNLTNVMIPENVNKIGEMAFFGCKNLKIVEFTDQSNLNQIGANAFSGCMSLVNITLPNSVTTIGENVFSNAGLTTITIPKKVKIITAGAFEGCAQLQGVFFDEHSELEKIDDNAFA